MSVKVLARPVVAHGRARVRVPRGDLDVAEIYSGVEHCGDESVPQHVGLRPVDAHAGRAPSRRSALILWPS